MLKLLSIIIFFTFNVQAICSNTSLLESTPVQADGRVKPLYVLAKEYVKFISGKSKIDSLTSTEVFCILSMNSHIKIQEISLPVLIEHRQAKELLGLNIDETHFEIDKILNQEEFIRAQVIQMKESTPLKKELTTLWNRLNKYRSIIESKSLTIAIEDNKQIKWMPLSHKLNEISSKKEFENILNTSKKTFINLNGDSYLLELTLYKTQIFTISLLILIVAIFFTVLFKNLKVAVIVSSLGVIVQLTGMIMRIMISGRAPITNMYETVMFSGLGSLIMALIILYFKRDKLFLLAGLGYNILCLFMMRFANNMLDESISPLVPVLRDNFWLSTHVTTIILSYAALALSWMLANIVLIKGVKGELSLKDQRYFENLINICVMTGVVLLSAGIILGGVWADYSWGRFWGWDPKETWSLIVFLFYIAILHGRYTNWLNSKKYILLCAAGFMTVMMAWFGVNYILASGLHSYGFSEGGAVFLGSFFLIQTSFIIFSILKLKNKNFQRQANV